MSKVRIIIEVDEDIEADVRLNVTNWVEDMLEDDLKAGRVKVLDKE